MQLNLPGGISDPALQLLLYNHGDSPTTRPTTAP